jgi:hypothetical protein
MSVCITLTIIFCDLEIKRMLLAYVLSSSFFARCAVDELRCLV